MTIRVLVADDQAVVRAGFRVVLGSAADIEVVGEAADGLAAAQRAATLRPDVVLMDVQMPGCDGIEATRRIAAFGGEPVRVLVVTTFDLDEYVYEALRAGASGFVLKDIEPDDLVTAVRTVHTGHALLAPAVTGRLIREFVQASPGHSSATAAAEPRPNELLTQREREVLSLVARGMSNSEIAEQMYVAETTVKNPRGTHAAQARPARPRTARGLRVRDRARRVRVRLSGDSRLPSTPGRTPSAETAAPPVHRGYGALRAAGGAVGVRDAHHPRHVARAAVGGPGRRGAADAAGAVATQHPGIGLAVYSATKPVSRQEELQSVIYPALTMLIVPFVLSVFLLGDDPESTLVTGLSLVPPFSPILMPARIALDVVPLWQIGVSAAVTIVAITAVVAIAGRVYAGAVLRTGSRVKLADALRPM